MDVQLCFSEIVGDKSCVQIANINAPAHCGDEAIFEAAIQEIKKLAEEAAEAKKLADEAAAEAEKLKREAENYCSHHWWC